MRRVSASSDRIVAVGAGTSALIVELLDAGYAPVITVDIAQKALDRLRSRLGDRADDVEFVQADVRAVRFSVPLDVWHDRATFHFLTDRDDQAAYAASAAAAVRPGGHLVMATFADNGPEECSGLPVARHGPASLASVFGDSFDLVDSFERQHRTPWGALQSFNHALMRRHDRRF